MLDLIDKIAVEANPELNKFIFAGIANIYTNDGREFRCRVDYPRGHANNPITDNELADKFRDAVLNYLGKEQSQRVIDATYELEKINDIGELMKNLACHNLI